MVDEVDANGDAAIVAEVHIEREDAGIIRGALAEFVFVARGGSEGVNGDEQALVRIMRRERCGVELLRWALAWPGRFVRRIAARVENGAMARPRDAGGKVPRIAGTGAGSACDTGEMHSTAGRCLGPEWPGKLYVQGLRQACEPSFACRLKRGTHPCYRLLGGLSRARTRFVGIG